MPRKKKTESKASNGELVVKRHGNRRLYNTETKAYVSYEELAQLVRGGRDVIVVDSTTDEDVTKAVLIQVILEEEKNKKTVLPTEFLFQILRSQENGLEEFFRHHLATSFNAYLKTKEEFDSRFRQVLETAVQAPSMIEKLIPGATVMREVLLGKEKKEE